MQGKLVLILAILFYSASIVSGQIQLFDDKSVVIGNRSTPYSNTYLHSWSKGKPVAFRLQTDFSQSAGYWQHGIYNNVYSNKKQYIYTQNSRITGTNRNSYGLNHIDYSYSDFYKFGQSIHLRGRARYSQGLRITNYTSGSTSKIGIYNYHIQDGRGTSYGIYNNQTVKLGNAYSIQNHLNVRNRGVFRNEINNIYLNTGSEYSNVIGSYNRIYKYPWVNRTRHVIGLYSNISGLRGYAGYFIGDVYIRGSLRVASDSRLKENVRSFENDFDALAIINELKPKVYNVKAIDGSTTDELSFGFLAEEVRSTVPSLVAEVEQPGDTEENTASPQDTVWNEDGTFEVMDSVKSESQVINGESLLSVKYTELIPVLVSAVQQQEQKSQNQFDNLYSSLDSLQSFGTIGNGTTIDSEQLNLMTADLTALEQKVRDVQQAMIDWTNCYDCDPPSDRTKEDEGKRRVDNSSDINLLRRINIDQNTNLSYNRSSKVLEIETSDAPVGLIVMDEKGKALQPFGVEKNVHRVDFSSWPDGIYRLKMISTSESSSHSVIFIKD